EGDASDMLIAQNPLFTGAQFETFSPHKTFSIQNVEGEQFIYALFKTDHGNFSEVVVATINYQNIPPTARVHLGQNNALPIGMGEKPLTLTVSETLLQTPSLSWKAFNSNIDHIVALSSGSVPHQYIGKLSISSSTPEGEASFYFSAIDISGTTGTVITQGTTFQIDVTPPLAPIIQIAAPQISGKAFLKWLAPVNEPQPLYRVSRSLFSGFNPEDGEIRTSSTSSTEFLDESTFIDTTFYYRVQAIDLASNLGVPSEEASIHIDGIPPNPVAGLHIQYEAGASSFTVSWNTPEGEVPAFYQVYRAMASTPSLSINNLIATTSSNSLFQAPTQVGRYYYRVLALDSVGNVSTPSQVANVLFDNVQPEVQSVNFSRLSPFQTGLLNLSITINKPMNNNIPLNVVFKIDNASFTIPIAMTSYIGAVWSGSINISTDIPETTGKLFIQGGSDIFGSQVTNFTQNIAFDFTQPLAPHHLSLTHMNNGSDLHLNWEAVSDAVSYQIFRATHPASLSSNLLTQLNQLSLTDVLPSFPSHQIFYAVKAVDSAGNSSDFSITQSTKVPLVPFLTSHSSFTLVTTSLVPIKGRSHAGAFVFAVSTQGFSLGSGVTGNDNQFSFHINLLPGIQEVQLYANSSVSKSELSRSHVFHFIPPPTTVAKPNIEPGDTTLNIKWPPIESDYIVGYWVYRDGYNNPIHKTRVPQSAQPQFIDIGLTNARKYLYRVLAEDINGQRGALSQVSEGTPVATSGWSTSE
ncbi:MAG: hypothetical protein ACKVQC_08310, partial [Elusimicrobiota bacterium]